MEELQESSAQEVFFDQGQVIWAKITGFPWWPAIISGIPNKRSPHFRVDFYADNTHAFVGSNKIMKYCELRSNIDPHKHMAKGLRKAIALADQALEPRLKLAWRQQSSSLDVEGEVRMQKQLLQSPSINQTLLQEKQKQEQFKLIEKEQPKESQKQQAEQSDEDIENSADKGIPINEAYTREQRQKYVDLLLKKYRLVNIPKLEASQKRQHSKQREYIPRIIKRKKVMTTKHQDIRLKKSSRMSQFPSVFRLIARKINSLLKARQQLDQETRKAISLNLARQFQSQQENPELLLEEMIRLCKWLDISPLATITTYYQSWSSLQSQKEKSSIMTTEQ